MKFRSIPHEIEAQHFQGASVSFIDENSQTVSIYKSMHGWVVKRKRKDGTPYSHGISIGDWYIIKPEFRIVSNTIFTECYEEIGANDG